MKRLSLFALALATPVVVMAQTTVFDDTFSGATPASTVNVAPTAPTATSTSYQTALGGPGGSGSIATGDFTFSSSSSATILTEIQALFANTPITLITLGDYIDISVTFRDTAGSILSSSGNQSSESLILGLFNSNGSAPLTGPNNLLTGGAAATGGVQNWQGFIGRVISSGTGNIITRPMQTGTTSQNQDLLFNNASSGSSFHFPTGTQLGTKSTAAANVNLTVGNTYTVDLRVTYGYNGGTGITISNALYNGTDTTTTPIYTAVNNTSGSLATAGATNSFDGFGLGWRQSAAATVSTIDISQVLITDLVQPVPEPASVALVFAGGIGILAMVRRVRR